MLTRSRQAPWYWHPSDRGNGKLSGETIANLNLNETELVFLSACDTAVGDTFDGEGVFGLQRAFHIAGAQNVICSLWQVDDSATALLVQLFYRNCFQLKHRPLQALRNAQLELDRNPLLLAQFKQTNTATYSRGRKFAPAQPKSAVPVRLPVAQWAGFVYSGI